MSAATNSVNRIIRRDRVRSDDLIHEVPQASIRPSGLYRPSLLFTKFLLRVVLDLSSREVSGTEHIPQAGGFILASNHASYFDPPILAVASPRQMTYMAKMELFANPLFSWLIHKLGAYPIKRGTGDKDAFETAMALLAKGHGLVVYPEGTRTLSGELGRLRIGAAMLALKAAVPIVPAWIEGSFVAWPKGGRIRRGHVKVRIGVPLKTDDLSNNSKSARVLTIRLQHALVSLSRM